MMSIHSVKCNQSSLTMRTVWTGVY